MKIDRFLLALCALLLFSCGSVAARVKLGVCTQVDNAEKVKAAGGDYVELSVSNFLIPLKSDAEFESNLMQAKASPLPVYSCNGFFPRDIKLTGPDRDHALALRYAETAFRRAQMIGIKRIVLGSGGARDYPQGYDRETAIGEFVDLLKQMGPIAAKYGVVVAIEPLNSKESVFLNTVAEGVAIVKRVDHKNIRCLADFYHMMLEGEGPEIIVREKKYICHCHVAEIDRSVPKAGSADLAPYYAALRKANYKGGLSIEARWKDFDREVISALAEMKERTGVRTSH